ncbi:MAG: aminotransferase class III-fold pyridoxal phosphate-dependent enzyme [Oscillospiraceae bacterium]|jgi:taurine--2-oxoglutarate transaminase|nr:aminotransferase class III-fold pyridoxal phosphate-dependent enzyme [Oscillospiraceae bacterium]
MSEIAELQNQYVLTAWSKQRNLLPPAIVRTEGIYLYDDAGKRYADMSSQLVNMNVGHGNKEIAEAIKEQADKYCYLAPSYACEPRAKLAEKLIAHLPDNFGKIFFTLCGSDANENALVIAKMVSGRNKIFSRYRSYHGSNFGAGNLTGEPRRFPLEPGIPGFVKFFDPYLYRAPFAFATEEEATAYYIAQLREQIYYEGPDQIAAIFLESVTGSNGTIVPPKGYMQGVRALCDEFGIFMVTDEVMMGFCRSGRFFCFENFDVKPDMVTFAKGVTCGYVPLGGVAVSSKIAAYFDDNALIAGLTYSGHPLACAAGIATLDYYDRVDLAGQVAKKGIYFRQLLDALMKKHERIGEVRSIGLHGCIELVKDRATKEPVVPYGSDPEGVMPAILAALSKKGFRTYTHENLLLVCPPLIITEAQLEEEFAKLDETLTELGY